MQDIPSLPRRAREPIFNVPLVIVACLAVILGVHALVEALSDASAFETMLRFGFVPATWTVWVDPAAVETVLQRAAAEEGPIGDARLALARYVLTHITAQPWVMLTYTVLHGSWMHVVLNSLWLAAFGTPVARRCGAWRFLALAAACALGGALAHWATHPFDAIPVVGASAAVSGLMASAARFVFVRDGWSSFGPAPHLRPRQSLLELLSNRGALIFVAVWFAINLVFGLAAVPLGLVDGGIAWEAHLGGFVIGLILFPVLDPLARHPQKLPSHEA